jgi:hypothetical protein
MGPLLTLEKVTALRGLPRKVSLDLAVIETGAEALDADTVHVLGQPQSVRLAQGVVAMDPELQVEPSLKPMAYGDDMITRSPIASGPSLATQIPETVILQHARSIR